MTESQPTVLSERVAARAVRVYSAIVLLFLIAPILVTIPLSFNAGPYFSYPMQGVSLRWYEFVFASADWQRAFVNSLSIGSVSALLATVLGTSAALGLSQPQFPARNLVMSLLVSPMIVPVVVVAVGLYLVFAPVGLVNNYWGLILAHTALGVPFVVITVTATLASFNWTLTRAAASLGARPWTVFRKVMLPLIMPGVVTGAIFAFATSFDEVIVVLFIGGVDQRTIPRQMWNGIRDQINPSILVVSTLLTLFAIALFVVMAWLRHRQASAARSR
ncbi:MAG: ABC transporter permease [Parvibaculaceae bacterium]|jgi:putative spermidine/putrescine transport system permease protein